MEYREKWGVWPKKTLGQVQGGRNASRSQSDAGRAECVEAVQGGQDAQAMRGGRGVRGEA